MAEVIPIRRIAQARRRRRQRDHLTRCIELIGESLRVHIGRFESAPLEERPARAAKIRKLGELLEYATSLL